MKTIVFGHTAAKQLDDLPADAREAVAEGLALYTTSRRGDVKRLAGREGLRLRVGRYRVLFDEDADAIFVLHVGKRETTTYR